MASCNRTLVGDLAVVENVPGERRAEQAGAAVPVEPDLAEMEFAHVARQEPEGACQGEGRVEVRLGDTDEG